MINMLAPITLRWIEGMEYNPLEWDVVDQNHTENIKVGVYLQHYFF